MTIREAAEKIWDRDFYFDLLESVYKMDCSCSNQNEYGKMVLCDRHNKMYQKHITRIMGIIEGVEKKCKFCGGVDMCGFIECLCTDGPLKENQNEKC